MIQISVVVCTYNRADILVGALESLVRQTLDKALFEIIVVDNASTDNTAYVVHEAGVKHGDCNLRTVYEPRQGLGYARNTGVNCAKGAHVAFLDDDARADKDWLKVALDCFARVNPSPLAVGGPIFPFYSGPRPGWFKDEFEIRTWGSGPRFLKMGETFSGSNMILRKEIVEKYGGFDVRIGMKGEYVSTGEETSLFERIRQCEGDTDVLYYSPELRVFHAVPAFKMTVTYQLKRQFAKGQARYVRNTPQTIPSRLGAIKRILRRISGMLFRSALAWRGHAAFQSWLIECMAPIVTQIGHLFGYLGIIIPVKQRER